MGYHLHITRKENWFDEDPPKEISLDEWVEYVGRDQEMRLDNVAEGATVLGDKLTYENKGLAVWTAYSRNGLLGNFAWFDFRNGNLSVKNPDDEIKNKMIEIARHLKAQVQGDDGEFYESKEDGQGNKPWWKLL